MALNNIKMKSLLNFAFILFLMAACLSEARMLRRTLKGMYNTRLSDTIMIS